MSLKYSLVENPMTPDRSDRMAVARVSQSYTLEDVITWMIRSGSTVTKAEALSVFEEFSFAIEQLVRDGNSISTPLFSILPRVVGTFYGDEDRFDESRHQVKLRINPGKRLRAIENHIAVEKVPAERPQPVPLHFYDSVSESENEVATPGGGATITGTLLKFDEADRQQGIFFIDTAGTEVRVSLKPLRNKPGELIFVVPALAAGTYRLEVRASINKSKTLRVGALPYELTVSPAITAT